MPQTLEPTYREALVHSWHFVAKHKVLWLLGVASVILGQFGLANFIGRVWHLLSAGFVDQDFWWVPTSSWPGLYRPDFVPPLAMSWLIGIVLALGFLIAAAGVCAEGTLIAAATSYLRSKASFDLEKAWQKGVENFWRLIAIKIVQQVFLLAVTFLMVGLWNCLPAYGVASVVVRVLIFSIGSVVALTVSVVSIFAAAYVVDKKYSFIEAVHEGWGLFREHILVSFELSILLLIMALGVVIILVIGAYAITSLSVFLLLLGAFSAIPVLTIIGIGLAGLLFAILAAFSGGFLNAFTVSVWMYCYAKMHRKGVPSRIGHYLGRFKS
jgi:hypothetical protein